MNLKLSTSHHKKATMKPNRPAENWTRYPNNILDNIKLFTPAEFKVLSLMVRKNLGFDSPNMKFSITYIVKLTGMTKPTVMKALEGLSGKGSIEVVGQGDNGIRLFDVSWSTPVKKFDRSNNLTTSGKEILPPVVKKFDPILENRVLENKVKETRVDEKYEYLALLLMKLHQTEDLRYKKSTVDIARWANDIRLLSERDNRTVSEIEAVIRWCKRPGGFWFPNIMSGKKLRDKFPTLISQMKRELLGAHCAIMSATAKKS